MEKVEFNKAFGNFVRAKRIEKNLTQSKLSDSLSIDYQYLSRIERGLISPTLFWTKRLANAFEMSLAEFVEELENYKPYL